MVRLGRQEEWALQAPLVHLVNKDQGVTRVLLVPMEALVRQGPRANRGHRASRGSLGKEELQGPLATRVYQGHRAIVGSLDLQVLLDPRDPLGQLVLWDRRDKGVSKV